MPKQKTMLIACSDRVLIQSLLLSSDIDECSEESHPCDKNANCTDRDGSFTCVYKRGFPGDGSTCTGMLTIVKPCSARINVGSLRRLICILSFENQISMSALSHRVRVTKTLNVPTLTVLTAVLVNRVSFYLNSEVFAAFFEVVAKAPLYFGSLWLLSNHILN